jgi:hypothetical protein
LLRKLLYKVKPYSSEAAIFRTAGNPYNLYHFLLGHIFPLLHDLESNSQKTLRVQSFGELDSWFELIDEGKTLKLANPSTLLRDLANNIDRRPLRRYFDLPYLVRFRVYDYWDRFEFFDRRPIPELAARIVELAQARAVPSKENLDLKYLVLDRKSKDPNNSSSLTREISNLKDLVGSLEEHHPSALVFGPEYEPAEMIRIVNSAKVLVGQTGAGLTHMLWLKPGSMVVEISLRPENQDLIPEWKNCYAALASRLGHRYIRLEIQDSWSSPLDTEAVAKSVLQAEQETRSKYNFNFRKHRIELDRARIKKFISGLIGHRH